MIMTLLRQYFYLPRVLYVSLWRYGPVDRNLQLVTVVLDEHLVM